MDLDEVEVSICLDHVTVTLNKVGQVSVETYELNTPPLYFDIDLKDLEVE